MITIVSGDIFQSKMKTITSPVNCKGIQGAGLAKIFKIKYPKANKAYMEACNNGECSIGKPYFYINNDLQHSNHNILFFPTKNSPWNPSKLSYIEKGLQGLYLMDTNKIESLALPALGAGLGGLSWDDVQPLMLRYLEKLLIPIEIYLPQ